MNLKVRLSSVAAIGLLLLVATPAFAQTYTMTLKTNASSYSGTAPIYISGTVSPAPGANTGVIITIRNSVGAIADVNEVNVLTNGSYSWTSYPGANSYWVSGTFSVNATWGSSEATLSQVASFSYTAATTTTTTSQTTVTTTANTSSTSSTVAEFPSSALAVVALIAMAGVALLSRKGAFGSPRTTLP